MSPPTTLSSPFTFLSHSFFPQLLPSIFRGWTLHKQLNRTFFWLSQYDLKLTIRSSLICPPHVLSCPQRTFDLSTPVTLINWLTYTSHITFIYHPHLATSFFALPPLLLSLSVYANPLIPLSLFLASHTPTISTSLSPNTFHSYAVWCLRLCCLPGRGVTVCDVTPQVTTLLVRVMQCLWSHLNKHTILSEPTHFDSRSFEGSFVRLPYHEIYCTVWLDTIMKIIRD